MTAAPRNSPFRVMIGVVLASTLISAIHPVDYGTWFFELFIGASGVAALAATRRTFSFSALFYYLVAVHYVILALGAKYTYAEMPLFNWLRDELGLARNHFDRVGHFFQGATLALLMREILIRRVGIKRGLLLTVLSMSVAVAFSGMYEVLEWLWVVTFYPTRGPEWLGMQGDPWDTQADIFMAFWGSLAVNVSLARAHDRSMAEIS